MAVTGYQYRSNAIFSVPEATAIAGSTMTSIVTNLSAIQYTDPTDPLDQYKIWNAKALFDATNGEAIGITSINRQARIIYLKRPFSGALAGEPTYVIIPDAKEISVVNASAAVNITVNGEVLRPGMGTQLTGFGIQAVGVDATGAEAGYIWL